MAVLVDTQMMGNRLYAWLATHKRLAWIFCLLPLLFWAQDRSPPFHEIKYITPPPVHAGDEVQIRVQVHRDIERDCSATLLRSLRDSNGVIHSPFAEDIGPRPLLSAESIERMEKADPGVIKRNFIVPAWVPSGTASIETTLNYRCGWNLLHIVWPIQVQESWPFTVLPPEAKTVVVIPPAGAPVVVPLK